MLRILRRLLALAILVEAAFCGALAAQNTGSQMPEVGPPRVQKERTAEDALTPEQRQAMVKKQNEQRQADIKKDTDKLLELATELKQYVDKTNKNVLSMDVIKKAEQIEKLAHSVKEKMKGQ